MPFAILDRTADRRTPKLLLPKHPDEIDPKLPTPITAAFRRRPKRERSVRPSECERTSRCYAAGSRTGRLTSHQRGSSSNGLGRPSHLVDSTTVVRVLATP